MSVSIRPEPASDYLRALWAARAERERPPTTEPLRLAYVNTLLTLLRREVTLETWAAASKSPSLAAACRPEWRDELCNRIERQLYPRRA